MPVYTLLRSRHRSLHTWAWFLIPDTPHLLKAIKTAMCNHDFILWMTLSANMICLLIQWGFNSVIFQDLLTSAWINAQYVFQVSMSAVERVISMQADTAEKLVPGLTTRSISIAQSFEKMKVCCTNSMMPLLTDWNYNLVNWKHLQIYVHPKAKCFESYIQWCLIADSIPN